MPFVMHVCTITFEQCPNCSQLTKELPLRTLAWELKEKQRLQTNERTTKQLVYMYSRPSVALLIDSCFHNTLIVCVHGYAALLIVNDKRERSILCSYTLVYVHVYAYYVVQGLACSRPSVTLPGIC